MARLISDGGGDSRVAVNSTISKSDCLVLLVVLQTVNIALEMLAWFITSLVCRPAGRVEQTFDGCPLPPPAAAHRAHAPPPLPQLFTAVLTENMRMMAQLYSTNMLMAHHLLNLWATWSAYSGLSAMAACMSRRRSRHLQGGGGQ